MTIRAANGHDPRDATPATGGGDVDVAYALRLLRLLITAVDHAEGGALTLSSESALVGVIRRMMNATAEDLHANRTALMALRDLVWRADTVRTLLESPGVATDPASLAAMLDTNDIHAFLRQEP